MISSSVGGGIVVFLAQFYFQRAFKTIDGAVKELEEVKVELATIAVKIDKSEKNDAILTAHGLRRPVN
jgi:predicted aspartyl protease